MSRIEHEGIVKSINDDVIEVSIVSHASCASCTVKGSCTMSEIEEKIIEVKRSDMSNYNEGETVNIFFKQALGFKALFFGYLLPFLIIMFVLVIGNILSWSELKSGGLAMATLPVYYLGLYLTRDWMKRSFNFSIEKK